MLKNKFNKVLLKFYYIKPSLFIGSITIIFLITCIIWIFFDNNFLKYELNIVKDKNLPEIEIEGAKFIGETDLGKKYFIEAKSILHNTQVKDSVKMTTINARILDKSRLISISSNKGVLDTKNFSVQLNGDVKLFDDSNGLEILTQKMNGNFHNGEYVTTAVYAIIKSAHISSSQMQFKEKQNKISFIGKTYLKIQ